MFVVFRTPPQATKLPALSPPFSLFVLTAMNHALPHLRHAARRIVERGNVARRLEAAVMLVIVINVLVLMLDSVADIHRQHGRLLSILEWTFTGLFTVEYLLRLWLLRRPRHYARSFFGIVDLLSILPVFLALLLPGLHVLADVRLLRLLRLFRILKLPVYLEETQHLRQALARARRKILVFIGVMVLLIMLLGTVIFLVEGPGNGFSSIPVGVYWAAVTMSTTGYGDITPQTGLGRLITGCAILLGYGIIAFPTGIMGAELFAGAMQGSRQAPDSCRCPCRCGKRGTSESDPT